MDWGGFGSWGSDWGFFWGGSSTGRAVRKQIEKAFFRFIKRYSTKVTLYFSYRSYGEDYDPYEQNYEKAFINPLTVKCYARELSPESLIFRKYGLSRTGAVELLVSTKYFNHFKLSTKIKINDNEYEVFKNNVGQYASIRNGPFNMTSVVLERKSGTSVVIPQYSKDICLGFKQLIRDYGKVIKIYPAYSRPGEGFDPDENNKELNYLNPISIVGYITNIKGLVNVLKQYGLQSSDAIQLVTDKSNLSLLKNSHKLTVNNKEYHVFKDNVGQNAVIQSEPAGLIRAILESV